MNITINKQSGGCLTIQYAIPLLEAELHVLEDAYAECLGDDVDAKTLTILWFRIKAIKKQIALIQ